VACVPKKVKESTVATNLSSSWVTALSSKTHGSCTEIGGGGIGCGAGHGHSGGIGCGYIGRCLAERGGGCFGRYSCGYHAGLGSGNATSIIINTYFSSHISTWSNAFFVAKHVNKKQAIQQTRRCSLLSLTNCGFQKVFSRIVCGLWTCRTWCGSWRRIVGRIECPLWALWCGSQRKIGGRRGGHLLTSWTWRAFRGWMLGWAWCLGRRTAGYG
jgi:hypothetical protein